MSAGAGADDPGRLREAAFALLARGVTDRRSPAHTPTLATVDAQGAPQSRTVVLRGFEPSLPELRFHTDIRSPKWAELRARPAVALHVYDPEGKLQVRLAGMAGLHAGDGVADEAWRASRFMSRVCYGTQPAPGTAIAAGDGFVLPQEQDGVEAGRVHFGAVLCRIHALDVLHLGVAGHRRARFLWTQGGVEAAWLAP
jgi:pyridoxamine 5'-phosphate oxidase